MGMLCEREMIRARIIDSAPVFVVMISVLIGMS